MEAKHVVTANIVRHSVAIVCNLKRIVCVFWLNDVTRFYFTKWHTLTGPKPPPAATRPLDGSLSSKLVCEWGIFLRLNQFVNF